MLPCQRLPADKNGEPRKVIAAGKPTNRAMGQLQGPGKMKIGDSFSASTKQERIRPVKKAKC